MLWPPTKKSQKIEAAKTCATQSQEKTVKTHDTASNLATKWPEPDNDYDLEIECTGWTGGVTHVLSDTDMGSDDEDWKYTDLDSVITLLRR